MRDLRALLQRIEPVGDPLDLVGPADLRRHDPREARTNDRLQVARTIVAQRTPDADEPARTTAVPGGTRQHIDDAAPGFILPRRRHTVLEIEDRDVELAGAELAEPEGTLDHPLAVRGHEHQRAHRGEPVHQYDRGIPSTCWPMYASTRLLLIGATSRRRVSRNLRSTSYSRAKPYPPYASRAALAASHADCDA